jgi:hypothetical protein
MIMSQTLTGEQLLYLFGGIILLGFIVTTVIWRLGGVWWFLPLRRGHKPLEKRMAKKDARRRR